MPFTPYHFGPAALIGLPLRKWIDIPVFVLANVVIDLEPLAVMVFWFDYPLHGYLHTFLIGGLVGLVWGIVAYVLLRRFFAFLMRLFRLSYQPTLLNMAISGLLGVWLHVFIDSFLYKEMNPFWPVAGNPFHAVVAYQTVYLVCEASLIIAVVIYPAFAWHNYRKAKTESAP
jgi:membrane-bound metal-dependent hydrolase YbcI (DUF457 family)